MRQPRALLASGASHLTQLLDLSAPWPQIWPRLLQAFAFDTVSNVIAHYTASHDVRHVTTDLLTD